MKNSKGKIVFVNPLIGYEERVIPNLATLAYPFPGIMIISTILKISGYEVKIIDANLYTSEDFKKKLFFELNNDILFIGFGLMTMNIPWAYSIIKLIKKTYPNLKIVVGGVHPSLFPDEMIVDENIDIVVINEATKTITHLADTLLFNEGLDRVNGIYYRESGVIYKNPPNLELDDFQTTPFIDFSLIDHSLYARNNVLSQFPCFPKDSYNVYPIQTSFGCAYRCNFCINSIFQRKYRIRPAEEIVNRIEYLQKEYGANFIAFYDEDFFANRKRLFKFVELIEAKGLKFKWRASLRVNYFSNNYIDDILLKRLENIGFICAVMGGESSSQRVLGYLNKGIKVEEILNSVKSLSKTNIVPKISFMVGIPGETEREILNTYRFVIKLKNIIFKSDLPVLVFRLYPGSQLYDMAINDYQFKKTYTIKELSSLRGEDMEKGWGYPVGDRPWINNHKKFDLMQFYFNTFIYPYYGSKGFLRHLLVKIVMYRFFINFFAFPFIEKTIYKIFKFSNKLCQLIFN